MSDGSASSHCITRLWLIRHGEPSAEIRGRCYGRLDAGLSEMGRRQLERAAGNLAAEPLAAIYSSPALRARESAGILVRQRGVAVEIRPEFGEIDFGDFEGLSYDEIAQRHPELYQLWMNYPTKIHFPGGESFAAMKERVLQGVRKLLEEHAGQSFALVSHGGVNRIVLADLLGVPDERIFRIGQGYAARNRIVFFDEEPVVEALNATE